MNEYRRIANSAPKLPYIFETGYMHPILLAIALTVHAETVKIASQTPLAGSWFIEESADLRRWRVVASGSCTGQETVCATLPKRDLGFVRVEFLPR